MQRRDESSLRLEQQASHALMRVDCHNGPGILQCRHKITPLHMRRTSCRLACCPVRLHCRVCRLRRDVQLRCVLHSDAGGVSRQPHRDFCLFRDHRHALLLLWLNHRPAQRSLWSTAHHRGGRSHYGSWAGAYGRRATDVDRLSGLWDRGRYWSVLRLCPDPCACWWMVHPPSHNGAGPGCRRYRMRDCRYLDNLERQRVYVRNGWNLPGDSYVHGCRRLLLVPGAHGRPDRLGRAQDLRPRGRGVLLDHPAVAECGVVAAPDEGRGYIVKAYVVTRAGLHSRPGADQGAAGLREGGDRALQISAGDRVSRQPAAHRDRQAPALPPAGADQ